METIDHIVLVDNNVSRSSSIEKNIKDEGIAKNIKTTLNGGHALLYLEHISEKIQHSKVLVLLNVHTPMVNGFEFIESYKGTKNLKKNNIVIAVMKDNLSQEEIDKIKSLGISDFISSQILSDTLNPIIQANFPTKEKTEKKSQRKKDTRQVPGTPTNF
jgi:DNA-binding NtrC family response regulator